GYSDSKRSMMVFIAASVVSLDSWNQKSSETDAAAAPSAPNTTTANDNANAVPHTRIRLIQIASPALFLFSGSCESLVATPSQFVVFEGLHTATTAFHKRRLRMQSEAAVDTHYCGHHRQ